MSLDLFKQLLRAALQAKAAVLHIRVDRVPSAQSAVGLNDLPCHHRSNCPPTMASRSEIAQA